MLNFQWIMPIIFHVGFIFGNEINSEFYNLYNDTKLALDFSSIRTFRKEVECFASCLEDCILVTLREINSKWECRFASGRGNQQVPDDAMTWIKASEWETFMGPKSCSEGFTNYWKYGCYRLGGVGNWADLEADCQSFGQNVHLAGMETLEELIAVTEAVKNTQNSWIWLGGKYNSTSGKYYWVGSGLNADVAAMYDWYPQTGRVDYNLALATPNPILYAVQSSFTSLCEEY